MEGDDEGAEKWCIISEEFGDEREDDTRAVWKMALGAEVKAGKAAVVDEGIGGQPIPTCTKS